MAVPVPVILLGSYPSLNQATANWLSGKCLDQPRLPTLVLTPSARAATRWFEQKRDGVEVFGVREFAETLVPLPWTPVPKMLSRLVHANLPPDLAQAIHPEPLPGIHLTAIETILQCRDLGLGPEALALERPYWVPLGRLIDRIIPDHVFDAQRIYQYAKTAVLNTPLPYQSILVEQAGLIPAAAIEFLQALALRAPMLVTVEPRAGIGYRLKQWQRARPRWIRLASPIREPEVAVVSVSHAEMADAALAALEDLGWMDPVDVIDDEAGLGKDLFRRLGPFTDLPRERAERWRQFWRVSQGQAGRAETIRWLTSLGVSVDAEDRRSFWRHGRTWYRDLSKRPETRDSLEWARGWGRRLFAASTLSAVANLVTEAWGRYSPEPLPWAQELRAWRAMDSDLVKPSAGLVRQLMDGLADGSDWTPDGESVLHRGPLALTPPALVAAAPRAIGLHWFAKQSTGSAHLASATLLSAGARLRWGLNRPDAQLYRFLWQNAPSRGAKTLYVVAREEEAHFRRMMPGVPATAVAPRPWVVHRDDGTVHFAEPISWYQSHRQSTAWDAWSGWGRPRPEPIWSSPSRMERYGTCPLAYFYQSILEVGEPDLDAEAIAPSRALVGRWAHATLESLATGSNSLAEATPEVIGIAVRAALDRVVAELPAGDRAVEVMVSAVTKGLASELAQAVFVHRDLWQAGPSVEAERPMDWVFGDIHWHGRVDRFDLEDGRARLIDYKTGVLHDPNQMRPDNIQLAIYREGLAQSLHLEASQIDAALVGVSARNQFRRVPLLDASELLTVVSGMADRIHQGRFHPLPQGGGAPCRTCAYRLACPDQVAKEARLKWAHDASGMQSLWLKDRDDDG